MPVIGPPPAGTSVSLRIVGGTTSELDLTQYMILVEGEGFDPADGGFLEPMFNDSSTGSGQGLINIDVGNKEFSFPLHLKSATKDGLHTLIRSLRLKLDEPGILVEWRDYGATDVTYYDIEFGRFDPDWKFHRAKKNWVRGVLKVWVRPYGHTATERYAGTGAGSGFMQIVSVSSVAGDVGAVMVCDLSSASQVRDLYGLSVIPSGMIVEWSAASLPAVAIAATSTLTGASGACGSQYRGIHITASELVLGQVYIPQASRTGDHRILALARTPNLGGLYIRTRAYFQAREQPTAFLGATYPHGSTPSAWQGWQLIDLGPLSVPQASMRAATEIITLYGSLASYSAGSLMASPGLHLNAVYVVPEDRTSIVVDRSILRSTPNRARFDGTIGETYNYDEGRPFTGYQRGGFQTVNPGEQVAAFALGRAANDPLSVTVRLRERFSFQR
jgi:hypothetical protein